MHYFSIFFKKINKQCINFSRVWTKNTNCWEILKIFDKNFILWIFWIYFKLLNFVTIRGLRPPDPMLGACDRLLVAGAPSRKKPGGATENRSHSRRQLFNFHTI